MQVNETLLELFGRIPPLVREAVEGLDHQQLVTSPAPGANPGGPEESRYPSWRGVVSRYRNAYKPPMNHPDRPFGR